MFSEVDDYLGIAKGRERKEGIVPKLCIKILEKVSPLTPSSSILR